jgi:transcriptional regulator with XRE-family HTH domain
MERTMKKTEVKSTMGTRIREMRKAAGMSQEQLAELLCTKKATISAYENDRIDIKSSIVLEIAKALGCTGSYLLEGKQEGDVDARIIEILVKLKNDQVKEIALRQLQALALLA